LARNSPLLCFELTVEALVAFGVGVLLGGELVLRVGQFEFGLVADQIELELFQAFFGAAQGFLFAHSGFAQVFQILKGTGEAAVGSGFVAQKAAVLLMIFVGPVQGVLLR